MKDSKQAYYEKLVTNALMTREWVTYEHVMSSSETDEAKADRFKKSNLSAYTDYNVLKKAFAEVLNSFKLIETDSIVVKGANKRNRSFRYNGTINAPLDKALTIIKDVKRYWEFCQDSGGFFPESWLNHFFNNTFALLKIKEQKRNPLICVSLDRDLKHIDFLPDLYEAIKTQKVLKLCYFKRYEHKENVLLYPHLLKEYNGRWFVLGVDENGKYCEYSLDRIETYNIADEMKFIPVRKDEYEYWSQFIGVSQPKLTKVEHIEIKTHSYYMHNLFMSKRFHRSQQEKLSFGNHGDEKYGLLSIDIIPNKEFYGRMLLYGDEIEVVSPVIVRNEVRARIQALAERYSLK